MSEDASLDQFSSADADERSEDADDAPEDGDAGTSADGSEPAPAVSTYAWSPDGGECAACGESAERRWREDGERDGALVCADCKEW